MIQFQKALLGLSTLSAVDKVTKAQNIKDSMQSSGKFLATNMPITYASIQLLITNLHNANIAAVNGNASDRALVHEHERFLVSAFNFIKAHVEMVANTNPATAESIITAAGLQVSTTGGGSGVTELTLVAIGNGKVQVRVPRQTGEKAFVFESSTDNTTWVEFASSSDTKVTLTGQTPASTIFVRHYAISKTGKSAYSQGKSIIVL